MALLASNPEPLVLPFLTLLIGGGCWSIFFGFAVIVSAKSQNGAAVVVGILLVMLGLLPLLFLASTWKATPSSCLPFVSTKS